MAFSEKCVQSGPAVVGRTDREVLGRTLTGVHCSEGVAEGWLYEKVFRRKMLDLERSTRPRARPEVAIPTVLRAQS